MEWWQSLLIALVPSVLTAGITLLVSLVQIRRTRTEMEAKYDSDRKQHISKMRLDIEFEIYKELSEKVIALVSCYIMIFKNIDFDSVLKQEDKKDFNNTYKRAIKLYNEANISINKYAIFIPDKWYKRFLKIKILCVEQLEAFEKYVLQGEWNGKTSSDIKQETTNRTIEIGELLNTLISGLRRYISKLG